MTLGDALRSPRSRNLDLLRVLLAMAVIFSHAWPLALGPTAAEPLDRSTGKSLGGWAVCVFFFLSGLLITASAERKSCAQFWFARVRRILPGLTFALCLTLAMAVASGSTAAPGEAISWFLRAITLVSIEHRLPDAFAANPYPEVVNGPLWSLFHEILAYALCALFVLFGAHQRPVIVLLLVLAACGGCLVHDSLPLRLATFAPLFCAFAFGMAAYLWRDRIALRPALLICVALLLLFGANPIALGAIGLSLVALALLAPLMPLSVDASFGLYVLGWPVAQGLVMLHPGITPVQLAVLSIATTYPVALLSWHLVEKPNLPLRMERA